MFTYSGEQVDERGGYPTVEDVAIALGRIPRLCAAGAYWWSHLHYAALLMEISLWENETNYHLLPVDVARHALLYEAHKAVTALWIPGQAFEDDIQERIYEGWSIKQPHQDSEMVELLKNAATRAFRAEVLSFGPGAMKLLPVFQDEDVDIRDKRIVDFIWGATNRPEQSIALNSTLTLAYESFFKSEHPNIEIFRKDFGYGVRAQDSRYGTLLHPEQDQ